MNNNVIEHQFIKEEYFFPNWNIETLILGTFNPKCGEKVDYYYGRCRNNFWRIFEEISNLDYMYFHNNYERKAEYMGKYKFGCTDVIKAIELRSFENKKIICGQGYSDQKLFNKRICKTMFQFSEIKSFLSNNTVTKIINTWGNKNGPIDFINEINSLKSFCDKNDIEFIKYCPSTSGRLRGKENKLNLIEFYNKHLFATSP
jgi:G:T/U-mismatch repair DNA glycosylase